jgi:hypothetical protein
MKPDWDSLAAEYTDSKDVVIADVDCTTDGKSLCEKNGVSGYPTIKYGEPGDLKDYKGGRTLDDLKKFAAENLGPTCGPDNLDLCDEHDKKQIAKFMKFDVDELDIEIEEQDIKMKRLEATLQKAIDKKTEEVKELQEAVESNEKKKKAAITKASKKNGLAKMKMVKAALAQKTADADPDLAVDGEEL